MILNKFFVVGVTLGLATVSGLSAQSSDVTTGAAGVNAPASAVSFSPAISAGARTEMSQSQNAKAATTFGPYVTPSFTLGYKAKPVTIALGYEIEISGARGFGSASKSIGDNTYFDNHPLLSISGGVSPDWKLNALLDAHFKFNNGNGAQGDNKSDIFLNPDVEYKISGGTSVAAGYVMHRVVNMDTDTGFKAAGDSAGIKTAGDTVAGKSATAKAAVEPTIEKKNTLHAGVLTLKNNIAEGTQLSTYVRAGRRVGNTEGVTAYSYRFQTHLDFQSPVKALTGLARYRLNIENQKGVANIAYYNLVRLGLDYALSSNWSLNIANEAVLDKKGASGATSQLSNENYVGATFKF